MKLYVYLAAALALIGGGFSGGWVVVEGEEAVFAEGF